MVACRRMRLRRRDSGFRRNGSSFNFAVYLFSIPASSTLPFPRKRESLPASAGNSAKRNGRLSANAAVAAEIPAYAGMEEGAGMRDIADCLTLRRLRGGVKIRASEFLGGGGTPTIIAHSPPPATASRSHPPPQAAEGKKLSPSVLPPIPAKAGISRLPRQRRKLQ